MTGDPNEAERFRREREAEERDLDEAIEESFPASDPLATTGTSAGAPPERRGGDQAERPAAREG